MLQGYEDIGRRIGVPPLWHDEAGVPRYDPFEPRLCADIYCDECALVLIACQGCGDKFKVAFSASHHRTWMERGMGDEASFEAARYAVAQQIRDGSLHYGDPPRRDCCPAGPTMNCEDLIVLEYWRRRDDCTWERDSSLEIQLPDGLQREQGSS